VVVTVPDTCTGWRTQYPPVLEGRSIDVAVLVVGTGAVLDRELDGAFAGPCSEVARDWYRTDVVARLSYLAERSEQVVLVLPAWAEDWSGWVNPQDHIARTDCVRATLREAAGEATATASDGSVVPVAVVDLGQHLCPDGPGACRPVRSTDGVHIDPTEAGPVLEWVVEAALGAADLTPGG
jgi:hypothetical protein